VTSPPHPDTLLAHAGGFVDARSGAVVPPIHTSTTFARDGDYELRLPGVQYARDQNPAFEPVERVLAALEGGAAALVFSSGMAAATAVFRALAPGDHVLVPRLMYHGLRDWVVAFGERWGVEVELYEPRPDGTIGAAARPGRTRLVWVETPSNPTWATTDLAAAAELAHGAGARLAVDSTVPTPILTRPLEHGADLVFHSATKALNGHSDVVAGVLVAKVEDAWWSELRKGRKAGGAILGAFEAWLLLRGLRTLHLRMRRACDSALAIARHFRGHARVERVLYPGLEEHPGHELARRQMNGGFGAMLSLLVAGDATYAREVACRTHLFLPATSLGGTESLIEHRASVEGPGSPVPPNLLRLSIGLEHPDELIADLDRALA